MPYKWKFGNFSWNCQTEQPWNLEKFSGKTFVCKILKQDTQIFLEIEIFVILESKWKRYCQHDAIITSVKT